jgi:hypothetical protein
MHPFLYGVFEPRAQVAGQAPITARAHADGSTVDLGAGGLDAVDLLGASYQ